MKRLPAIAIGGPPHSGKSVLVYSLTQALRRLQVEHYVLRACPDGEGDWSNEAPAELVEQIRDKGQFTQQFVDRVCRDLGRRNLPLLVDVGGRPQPDQEAIFAGCTHAILLIREDVDRQEDGLERWHNLVQQYDLTILAEYTSALEGQAEITAEGPILQGKITGLERHTQATGPVFDALLQRVCAILDYDEGELRERHLKDAPTELTLEVDRSIAGINRAEQRWQPEDLSGLLDYLPDDEALSIYGRGPGWLSAAIALHITPAPCYLFDPRLGWITPLSFKVGKPSDDLLNFSLEEQAQYTYLHTKIVTNYLDYEEMAEINLPPIPDDKGVILSGKLPNWLVTAMALHYQHHVPWIAIYQPVLGSALVVSTWPDADLAVGDLVVLEGG